jgi:CheY-like chemotaxis protein
MEKELLKLYVDNIHGGHIIVHPNQTFEYSEQLIKTLGYVPEKWSDPIMEAYKKEILEKYNNKENINMAIKMCTAQNEHLWMVAKGKYVEINYTKIMLLLLCDITKTKDHDKLIKQATKNAEDALQSKTRFLATMSHEIRTPLNGIIGMTDLLNDMIIDAEAKSTVNTINLCSKLLLTLINNILDYSKLEDGKISLNKQKFNIKECCTDILNVLKPINKQNMEIILDIDSINIDYLVGDRVRFTQILTNILGNAIKFTEKGYVKLTLTTSDIMINDETKCQLDIIVKDTGIGISKYNLNNLFETYNQIDPNIHKKYGGTGLGLVIAKSLCKLMDGNIWAESELGMGSTFYITVLMDYPIESDLIKLNSSDNLIKINKSNVKILVAEDNNVNQIVIKKMLQKIGYSCSVANNGLQAVNIMKENRHDIILMDIHMPIMDGFEATKIIRELGMTHVKIIALTANAMKEDRDRCLNNMMDDYLSKPIDINTLKQCIDKYGRQLSVTI